MYCKEDEVEEFQKWVTNYLKIKFNVTESSEECVPFYYKEDEEHQKWVTDYPKIKIVVTESIEECTQAALKMLTE